MQQKDKRRYSLDPEFGWPSRPGPYNPMPQRPFPGGHYVPGLPFDPNKPVKPVGPGGNIPGTKPQVPDVGPGGPGPVKPITPQKPAVPEKVYPAPTYQDREYEKSQSVMDAQNAAADHLLQRPGEYQNQYEQQLNDLADKITNREFDWSPDKDAMYQQQLDRYIQRGKAAMQDTMGRAAAMTGGYGNSYAQGVGQQAYQGYLEDAAGLAGEYMGMALDRYRAQGDDLVRQYNIMSGREQDAYGRYQDNLSRYLAEQDRLDSRAEREADRDYDRFWQNQQWDYGVDRDVANDRYRDERDAETDRRYQEQWQHQLERDEIMDQQWQAEFDENRRRYNAEHPGAPSSSGHSSSGSGDRNAVLEWKEWVKKQQEQEKKEKEEQKKPPKKPLPGGGSNRPHSQVTIHN